MMDYFDAIESRFKQIAQKRLEGDWRLNLLMAELSGIGNASKPALGSLKIQLLYKFNDAWSMAEFTGDFSRLDAQMVQAIDEWAAEQKIAVEPIPPTQSRVMRRKALIETHGARWPTIDGDIRHAAENGLSSAKAGARGWDEERALAWAKSQGKLIADPGYSTRVHRMG
ncbi:hypothetical protein [Castellaniella defragrans]|uniref:hypothetical protein n=1 Tax=Castellaniella defragrans TaxID=75697 RepID=UPI0011DE55F0|nr:hypothetical protein [Castellaniella defragrans]